jgi:predicted transcriptional regulator
VDSSKQLPLTDSQREIMEIVWERGEVTASDVRLALEPSRKLARNTVQTMLVRLEQRGWLTHREEGRSFVYRARKPRSKSMGAKVVQMVDRLFSGSVLEMVTALIDYRGLTREETSRIRAMIEQAQRESEKSSSKKDR